MKNPRLVTVAGILFMALIFSATPFAARAEDVYVYASPDPGVPFSLDFTSSRPEGVTTEFKPLITYTYIPISDTLAYRSGHAYGPYTPYAVSVQISSVSNGLKVTVNIQVDGVSQWSGDLGAGQSSPTITVDGGSTLISVTNYNVQTVTFQGQITLINN